MRALAACLSAACVLAAAPAAAAYPVTPKSAPAFRDSVGVVTHAVYYDTAYGDWPKVVARLQELGVRHLRDGVYANPTDEWRDWNERYYRAVELAAAHGMRFIFGMGSPGSRSGTLDQLIAEVAGASARPRRPSRHRTSSTSTEGSGSGGLPLSAYGRELYLKAKANPSLRSLPVLGPSFSTTTAQKLFGDQHSWMDVGNVHPYTGGLSPDPDHLRTELKRARAVSGGKPVWATEAGFHNALRARSGQPPVSEAAAAALPAADLPRALPQRHRADLRLRARRREARARPARSRAALRPPAARHDAEAGLQRPEEPPHHRRAGTTALLAFGRFVWISPVRASTYAGSSCGRPTAPTSWHCGAFAAPGTGTGDARCVCPHAAVTVAVPGAARVAIADPVASAHSRPLRLRHGRVRVGLDGRPLVLSIAP